MRLSSRAYRFPVINQPYHLTPNLRSPCSIYEACNVSPYVSTRVALALPWIIHDNRVPQYASTTVSKLFGYGLKGYRLTSYKTSSNLVTVSGGQTWEKKSKIERETTRKGISLYRKCTSRLLETLSEQPWIPTHLFQISSVLTMKSTEGNNTRLHRTMQIDHFMKLSVLCLVWRER